MAGLNMVVCESPKPSTTGFTVAVYYDKIRTGQTFSNLAVSWVALVPKSTWTPSSDGEGGSFGGDTIQGMVIKGNTSGWYEQKGEGKGSANFPNASSGDALTI